MRDNVGKRRSLNGYIKREELSIQVIEDSRRRVDWWLEVFS
jgi:hypothetical protein